MTDESPLLVPETEDVREIELPRWVQLPVGIVLSLFTLLCGFASGYLLFVPNKKAPILAFVVGFILLLGCLWVLAKCFRLITGRKTRGGLLSPRALRVVSVFLLVLPVVGLLTGYYHQMDVVAVYLSSSDVFVWLFRVAGTGSKARV